MSLNLHSGGELVDYDAIRRLPTPAATATHVPIEHHRLIDLVRGTLSMHGHTIEEEHHAIDCGGDRYFGLMTLKSAHGFYTDTIGLRNSHDRKFPIGIAFGSRVFICSNLAFVGESIIKRKHTAKARVMLPGLLMEIIEPLAQKREAQAKTFERYKATPLTDDRADHLIMKCYRDGVYGVQKIADIAREWETPTHDHGEKSYWRFFNGVTFGLTGRVAEQPQLTRKLHQVIDADFDMVPA